MEESDYLTFLQKEKQHKLQQTMSSFAIPGVVLPTGKWC